MFDIERKIHFLVIALLISAGLIIAPIGTAFAQGEPYETTMSVETSGTYSGRMENGQYSQSSGRMPTEGRTPEKMVFDFAFVRTLGLVGLALGTAAFVVSSPFSGMGGNAEEAYHRLVVDPAKYTFQRPLGAF
jgi:hypothetical protein